ncbi:MAG: beta-ketoacyl-ACP synthase [Myxococcota bacterium]
MPRMTTVRPYPITAYGLCTGLGRTAREHLAALREGRRGLRACPIPTPFEALTGTVPGDLPDIPAGAWGHHSRTAQVALLGYEDIAPAVDRAVQRWGAERVALIAGTSTGGVGVTEDAHEHFARTGEQAPEGYDYHRQHPFHVFVEALRERSGIAGPRYVPSTACSSSGKVFASARRLLDLELVDAVLVGGVDGLCHTTVDGFHHLGVQATVPCRPFGVDRPGMNIGEGGAFVLLEREGEGPAWLLGVGETSDAFHQSSPDPEGHGAIAAMRQSLAQAGLEPEQVDHINAHGTGTAKNDVAEARAIEAVFGLGVPVASTKGYTGHTLGACGAVEAIFGIMAIEHGFLAESVGSAPIDPDVHIPIVTERADRKVSTVLSNAFAFGGNNCSVLLGGPR